MIVTLISKMHGCGSPLCRLRTVWPTMDRCTQLGSSHGGAVKPDLLKATSGGCLKFCIVCNRCGFWVCGFWVCGLYLDFTAGLFCARFTSQYSPQLIIRVKLCRLHRKCTAKNLNAKIKSTL